MICHQDLHFCQPSPQHLDMFYVRRVCSFSSPTDLEVPAFDVLVSGAVMGLIVFCAKMLLCLPVKTRAALYLAFTLGWALL